MHLTSSFLNTGHKNASGTLFLSFGFECNFNFEAFGPLGNGREMLTDPVLVEISKKKKKTTAQVRNVIFTPV